MFSLYTFTKEFISALCHGCVTQLFLQRHLFFLFSFLFFLHVPPAGLRKKNPRAFLLYNTGKAID